MRGMATTPTPDDPRLAAVLARRPLPGVLYGVTTQRVYCRPGCPSPAPRPAHVVLFADAAEARAAGYRPCRRCDPDGARAAVQAEAVAEACRMIAAAETLPSLAALAARAGYAPHHFHRIFAGLTGLTPRAHARAARRARLSASLAAGARVADAVAEAGYGSESRVYGAVDGGLGMTPGAARRGGAGEVIRVAAGTCRFGPLLVGRTGRGVCFVGFGRPEPELRDRLAARFPEARLVEGGAAEQAEVAAVAAAITEPQAAEALPLDLRGTLFQQRVWDALRRIPPGETRRYAEVADGLGLAGGARAVAAACAANPVAVLVPCHRVVGADGALRGYAWGVEAKRALIAAERR
jgi:AraC family transcriptional regulator of adaptative response/methylated-DNA-[protein]-cysteine methyltransferase